MDKSNDDDFLKLPQKPEAKAGDWDDDPSEYEKMLDKRWLVCETAMRMFVADVRSVTGEGSARITAEQCWDKARILWESKPEDL